MSSRSGRVAYVNGLFVVDGNLVDPNEHVVVSYRGLAHRAFVMYINTKHNEVLISFSTLCGHYAVDYSAEKAALSSDSTKLTCLECLTI